MISGKLKPGDRIVGVGQGASGEMKDVVGWRIDDAVELIRGTANTQVRLDVRFRRSADGQQADPRGAHPRQGAAWRMRAPRPRRSPCRPPMASRRAASA